MQMAKLSYDNKPRGGNCIVRLVGLVDSQCFSMIFNVFQWAKMAEMAISS